jgi:hypothetical protein
VDVGVARAGELVDEIGVKTVLTQPVAARRQRSSAGDEAADTLTAVLME